MARTAPVPNFPAIPGMNPGIFLMGGGGDGGGSGPGGGKGKGKGQGGNGKGDGNGANGDGKGAGGCGPGSGGGCANPAHGRSGGTHAGDPVDPVTGRVYTIPQTDLPLVGPLVFALKRAYSSFARERDIGLGFGWSHSLAWSIEVRRRTLVIAPPFLEPITCEKPESGAVLRVRGIGALRIDGGAIILTDAEHDLIHWFEPTAADPERYQLAALLDRAKNRIALHYDAAGELARLTDSAGRTVHVRRAASGRIEGFELVTSRGRAVCHRRHEHDDRGDLVATIDAEGRRVRIEHGPGTTTIYDSQQTRRLDHNAHGLIDVAAGPWVESLKYDAAGHVIEYGDPNNQATRYERDAAGRVIAVIAASGERTAFQYTDAGDLAEAVDELGAVLRYAYDDAGNLLETTDALGSLLRCEYDARGLRVLAEMPNGAITRWDHDAEGNLITLTEPHGRPRRFEVDDLGRIGAFSDEEGHRTAFDYDSTNILRAVTLPTGATYKLEHDVDGRIAAYTGPDGATWRLRWGGYNCIHTLEKPTGEALRLRYDREGNLVQVVNERGEVHRIERDAGGRIVAETFFDGRTYRYQLDAAGRLVRHQNGAGEWTEIERDLCGRILRRAYDDGTADAFEYDAIGRLTRADNGAVCCTWSYDARGNLTRETQVHESRTVTIEHTYDAANQRTSTRANVGYSVAVERDVMGRAARLVLADGAAVERTFDALGREVLRSLPRGGHMICRYDGIGAMVERRIAGPAAAAGEPAWIGVLPPGTTFAERFACSPAGDLIEHATSDGERERFAYDPAGRILGRSSSAGAPEVYAYEGTGRPIEPLGPARSYGPGGVLLSRGAERYTYDGEGRRATKSEGGRSETRYEWNGRGMLAAVALDGSRVENVYDTQGRRIVKRTRRPDGSRTETRFAWAGDEVIHELTWSLVPGSAPAPVVARAYVYDDDGAPLAHRETTWTDGAADAGEWTHYALGPGEMPALLVAGDGAILARLRASVWGRIEHDTGAKARTPWRFLGQYEDTETGLFYNRFRFYDAAIGLYVSPDPIGLAGGLGAYEYARAEPFRVIDPEGLTGVTAVVTGHGITGKGKSAGLRGDSEPFIHPIVAAAMPPMKNGVYPTGKDRPPSTCAEPGAISSFIKKWEEQNNGGRQLDPNNPRDRNKIQKCLGSIKSMGASQADGPQRAPCANCSQMLQNLRENGEPPRSAPFSLDISPIRTTPKHGRMANRRDRASSPLPTGNGSRPYVHAGYWRPKEPKGPRGEHHATLHQRTRGGHFGDHGYHTRPGSLRLSGRDEGDFRAPPVARK